MNAFVSSTVSTFIPSVSFTCGSFDNVKMISTYCKSSGNNVTCLPLPSIKYNTNNVNIQIRLMVKLENYVFTSEIDNLCIWLYKYMLFGVRLIQ